MITYVGAESLQCAQIINEGIGEIREDVQVQGVVPRRSYTQGEVSDGSCWDREMLAVKCC